MIPIKELGEKLFRDKRLSPNVLEVTTTWLCCPRLLFVFFLNGEISAFVVISVPPSLRELIPR